MVYWNGNIYGIGVDRTSNKEALLVKVDDQGNLIWYLTYRRNEPHSYAQGNSIDEYEDFYVIFTQFDLAKHVERLQRKHPEWTERQLYCCLFWQGKARKNLKEEIDKFKRMFTKHQVFVCPFGPF